MDENQSGRTQDILKVYEQFSELIFKLLMPESKEKSLKSWKNKLQSLKRKLSK